jgi:putative component of toxin-antitoxin plasmid stabilization module
MKHEWEFWAVLTPSGNVLVAWIGNDGAFQARLDATLRRLQDMYPLWPMPYYRPLGEGVGEIRFDFRKEEQRAYGYFSGRRFVILFGISGKQKQQESIKSAKRLKKQHDENGPPPTERYHV